MANIEERGAAPSTPLQTLVRSPVTPSKARRQRHRKMKQRMWDVSRWANWSDEELSMCRQKVRFTLTEDSRDIGENGALEDAGTHVDANVPPDADVLGTAEATSSCSQTDVAGEIHSAADLLKISSQIADMAAAKMEARIQKYDRVISELDSQLSALKAVCASQATEMRETQATHAKDKEKLKRWDALIRIMGSLCECAGVTWGKPVVSGSIVGWQHQWHKFEIVCNKGRNHRVSPKDLRLDMESEKGDSESGKQRHSDESGPDLAKRWYPDLDKEAF